MTESFADRLILAAGPLTLTDEHVNGMTADDMSAVARYLTALAEHGHHVCALAEISIDKTTPEHPTRAGSRALDLQASLGHLKGLFDAAIHFASEAQQDADSMTAEEH